MSLLGHYRARERDIVQEFLGTSSALSPSPEKDVVLLVLFIFTNKRMLMNLLLGRFIGVLSSGMGV